MCPMRHAATVDVVRQVIDQQKTMPTRMFVRPRDDVWQPLKVNVVNRFAVFKAVNQIKRRAANAFDGGQAQLHRSRGDFNRLRTPSQS